MPDKPMIPSEATTAGRQSVEGERCPKCGADRIPYQPCPELQVHHDCGTVTAARDGRFMWHGVKCLEAQLAAAQERAKEAEAYDDQIQAANRRLAEANEDLTRRYFEMRRVLERVEWAALVPSDISDRFAAGCPSCKRPKKRGHTADCELAAALASSPANPYAAVVEAARELAVALHDHNEKALQRYRMENLGEHADLEDDEGDCCDICCYVSDLLYDLGQKLGAIGIDDLSKIPDIRDLAKLEGGGAT